MSISFQVGSLIDPIKYMVHTAQLYNMSTNQTGQTVVSTITTVSCYVFYGYAKRVVDSPVREQTYEYEAIIPNTLTVKNDDQLVNIVNNLGEQILNSATIMKSVLYDHYKFGNKFGHLFLRVN